MVLKRPTMPMIDQGSISRLYPLLKPNFLRLTERIWGVEDYENKRQRARKEKGKKKNREGPAKIYKYIEEVLYSIVRNSNLFDIIKFRLSPEAWGNKKRNRIEVEGWINYFFCFIPQASKPEFQKNRKWNIITSTIGKNNSLLNSSRNTNFVLISFSYI